MTNEIVTPHYSVGTDASGHAVIDADLNILTHLNGQPEIAIVARLVENGTKIRWTLSAQPVDGRIWTQRDLLALAYSITQEVAKGTVEAQSRAAEKEQRDGVQGS